MAVAFNELYKEFCWNVNEEAGTQEVAGWERVQVNCNFTMKATTDMYMREYLD